MAPLPDSDPLATTAVDSGTQLPALSAVRTIGRYRLERELGAGGMGVVHAAFDPELERRVALKILRAEPSDDARARLLREARAMARLTHPNVVAVHEVGTVGAVDYVAMELVEGESVAEWLAVATRSTAEVLEVFMAAGRGLAAAHAAGLIHRDFKPQNVLRSRSGRVLVTDFGLARLAGAVPGATTASNERSGDPVLTGTGTLMGTPAYMAPEQWRGGDVGPATDQFAFCVSLWEALAGTRPFPGESADALRAAIERGPATLDASRIPKRLRGALLRGLDPDPAKRWPSLDALLARLPHVPARRGLLAAAALLVVAVLVAARFLMAEDSPRPGGPQVDPLLAKVTKFSDGHVTAPPAALARLSDELRTRHTARFVSTGTDTGPLGFKLYAIRVGSFLDASGLVNGDVLIAIDEESTADDAHLTVAVDKIPSSPRELRLGLIRSGKPMTITVTARP